MDKAVPDLVDTLQGVSMQLLGRLSADLAALEALASVEEMVPDRKASAALFHRSAQKGCAQMRRCLTVMHDLARWRSDEQSESSHRVNNKLHHGAL
jgi:hypothetical protein